MSLLVKLLKAEQLDIADFKGQTPLMLVAEDGCSKTVASLLAAGADPDRQDYQGKTALHSAIKAHCISCVDALIDHGCRVDLQTVDGRTPLQTAAWSGNIHAARRLVAIDPKVVEVKDVDEMTPSDLVRNLLADGAALAALNGELRKAGRFAPSRPQLEDVAQILRAQEVG